MLIVKGNNWPARYRENSGENWKIMQKTKLQSIVIFKSTNENTLQSWPFLTYSLDESDFFEVPRYVYNYRLQLVNKSD